MPALLSWRARLARWGGPGLRLVGLTLLILAAAGPRWPDLRTRIDAEGISIMMTVDVSESMGKRDFDWAGEKISRLEAVKRCFRMFVEGTRSNDPSLKEAVPTTFEGRPTDSIGLVAFATRPETVCPLTLSHSALLSLLDEQQPRTIPTESETNISDGITLALHRLRETGGRRKVIVLLTDGEHNVPDQQVQSRWTPRKSAHIAKSLGVPIYTIDAGSDVPVSEGGQQPGTVSSGEVRADAVQKLQELARISGGKAFQARDTTALLEACRAIDRLERSSVPTFQYRRYHEGYPWLALGAFLCWLTVLALERTFWRRLP